ncbi:MAG TPA: DUF4332 domain-containing protein [Spirochaetota bacterium]|nr:DUF4332 domain-containing protein [Spirochaetota bacterium]HOD15021.1 DUF4332 domain-containing protein [Spirochaetota bacterium]HPG49476.1 DUF4332 domain-containing protein [Spirochaetota bacterium]HPN11045.1 DUF4332 domain-containing protein [Spirochaetota bacterium]HQL81740.1 DUF4332 domain-containing protein [Spirochaetota bacterium]
MASLKTIEGIGPKYAQMLRKAGLRSTGQLLKKGSTPVGRKQIAKASGISEKLILEWTNHADLFRIKGVGEEYADLLEESGVDTVVELAKRKSDNLLDAMCKTNDKKKLVRKVPAISMVERWISQAKKLDRIIKH